MNKFLAKLRKGEVNQIGFTAKATGGELTLEAYDVIGGDFFGEGITAGNFSQAIKDAGDVQSIKLHINSPGGEAFEGVAIYNLLKATGKPINVYVDGLAASAASILAMAGDTITMGEGSVIMIHNAMSMAFGNAAEMRQTADVLDTVSGAMADIYVTKTGQTKDDVLKAMDAETWMDAATAIDKGFATAQAEAPAKAKATAAGFSLEVYNNVPETLKTVAPVVAEEQPVEDPTIGVMRKRIELMKKRG